MKRLIRRVLRDDRGGTAIEYGLIASLIVVAIIAAILQLAHATVGIWNDVSNQVTSAS